ncbi:MAG: hypothetical protein ACP5JG_05590 [Anaerolineae bacterium]
MMLGENRFGESLRYFTELAGDVVDASRVHPGESVAGYGPNVTGGTLIRPGGRDCYPAFWVRDFAMSLESGLIRPEEAVHALRLTLALQAEEDRRLPSGSFVPRSAIADHITFGGVPIFYPGTLDDAENQGGRWGYYPSLDDHYYVIEMAWHVAHREGRSDVLTDDIDGSRLVDRLALAFSVPQVRSDTELVWCDEAHRGVSFGFTDTVMHTGELLFCSLLRYRAAGRLAEFCRRLGRSEEADAYHRIQQTIKREIPRTFADRSGLLRASTGKSAQPDVWGSAFAIYVGALPEVVATEVGRALLRALDDGTISWRGQIRHVPTDADFSERTAWSHLVGVSADDPIEERPENRLKNRYQNGAYWGTPVGWICYAIARHDEATARRLALRYINELQSDDFRMGPEHGAPWECMHWENDHRQNPVYMASVTCPLGAFRRLGWIT